MKLTDLDSATVKAGAELDALIAEKWMGWKLTPYHLFTALDTGDDDYPYYTIGPLQRQAGWLGWSPSTNVAHAVEALLKADRWVLETVCGALDHVDVPGYSCTVYFDYNIQWRQCVSYPHETDGDKGRALALAACRAIVAAMKAREEDPTN